MTLPYSYSFQVYLFHKYSIQILWRWWLCKWSWTTWICLKWWISAFIFSFKKVHYTNLHFHQRSCNHPQQPAQGHRQLMCASQTHRCTYLLQTQPLTLARHLCLLQTTNIQFIYLLFFWSCFWICVCNHPCQFYYIHTYIINCLSQTCQALSYLPPH